MPTCKACLTLLISIVSLLSALAKECAPGCVKRGNCNQDEGTCQCKFGWTGSSCEVPLFPACQAGQWDLPQLGRAFPRNCECYKQAYKFFNCGGVHQNTCQYTSFVLDPPACYLYKGVAKKNQRSVLPDAGNKQLPTATWHQFRSFDEPLGNLPESERFVLRDPWGPKHTRVLPPTACQGSCSGNGVCVKRKNQDQPVCMCHKGWVSSGSTGSAPCGTEDMSLCPNKCLGRGRCIMGFCHCKPPFWGHDCGREAPVALNPQAIPSQTKLAIYIYELPAWLSAPLGQDDINHDRTPAHTAPEHFLASLLQDKTVRVLDPFQANLFYVPAHTCCYTSNTGSPQNHLARVLEYVSQTWPFFNRTEGRDHIVWTPGDKGACYTHGTVANVIKLTHFGYHVNRAARQNISYLDPRPDDSYQGCYNPMRDVVAPPFFDDTYDQLASMYDKVVANNGTDKNRSLLFFFAGSVRSHQHSYSGGARQAVHKLLMHMNKTGADMSDIKFIQGRVHNYWELHQQSKFCLCPSGSGFGMRLVMAMQHACIPVITSDLVLQPLEGDIPYWKFSIRIPNSALPRLVDILRAVTEEEQAALRMGMAHWYRALAWRTDRLPQGLAYEYTLRALHKRRLHLSADLFR